MKVNNPDPREARWLVEEKYGGRVTPAAQRDLARLARGEHISYLIGWAPFLGCGISLTTRPLIPRPETEHWVENEIKNMRGVRGKLRVLDLFCGSGCIGIAVLKNLPKARVDFADKEKKYFRDIRISLRKNRVRPDRARCVRSDMFQKIGTHTYDWVLANPPYIPSRGRAVAPSVLAQEPHNALFGGRDGLRYIRQLLRAAGQYLAPGGTLVIEFDPPQKRDIAKLAKQYGWQPEFQKDQYGRWRSVHLQEIRASVPVQKGRR